MLKSIHEFREAQPAQQPAGGLEKTAMPYAARKLSALAGAGSQIDPNVNAGLKLFVQKAGAPAVAAFFNQITGLSQAELGKWNTYLQQLATDPVQQAGA